MPAGQLTINGTDAYTEWGVSLENDGMDALMAFPPNKQPVVNKNVTANGAVVVCGAGLSEDRTVSVPLHLIANSREDFLAKRTAFQTAIRNGALTIVIKPNVTLQTTYSYVMYYIDCQQYTQFLDGMAKFILTLYQPQT